MFWSDLGPNIAYEAVGVLDSSFPTVGVWAKKSSNEEYSKGVVFYLDSQRKVIGILTWNVLGKMAQARRIIKEAKPQADLNELSKLFQVHE